MTVLQFYHLTLRNERILEVQKRNSLSLAAGVGIMLVLAKQLQHWNKKDSTALVLHDRFFMVTTWLPNIGSVRPFLKPFKTVGWASFLWGYALGGFCLGNASLSGHLEASVGFINIAEQRWMLSSWIHRTWGFDSCHVLRPLSCNVFGLWWSTSSKLSDLWRGSNTIPFLFGYGPARRDLGGYTSEILTGILRIELSWDECDSRDSPYVANPQCFDLHFFTF